MSLSAYFTDRIGAEIRQQMDGILALVDQLGRHRLPPEAQACAAGVAAAAGGVNRILDSAAALQGLEGADLLSNAEPVGLQALMDAVQERWQARASQGRVTLLVSYDGPPEAMVEADTRRLLQVFDGFAGKAIACAGRAAVEIGLKAWPDGPLCRLEARFRSPRQPGWEEQDLETRARAAAERYGLEVALDMMVARQAVAGFGGQVIEEPDAAGFILSLPVAARAAEPRHARAMEDGRSVHVLIVDDNATNRIVAQALCEMLACTTETADDGLQAVEAARGGRFDLILMDIRMPGMDGVAATRAIRAMPGPAGATPIIALTANADPEEARAYIQAGMLGVIEKPMKAEVLRAALVSALGAGGAKAA
ncbi:response regulator [Phenylobacterium sp.]|jgi:CheY-like chemotaxis protein|uniref:response regulator n=1 Tax=Phenylobacterium sp. TaxID=1871053 RepID=UPI0037838DD2